MKNNEEFTQSVFNKSNRIIEHRRKVRRKIATGLGTLSVAVLIVTGLNLSGAFQKNLGTSETSVVKDDNGSGENSIINNEITGETMPQAGNDQMPVQDAEAEMAPERSDINITKITISCVSNDYEEAITQTDIISQIIDWLNEQIEEGNTVKESSFKFTLIDDKYRNTVYLPDNDIIFDEFMTVIKQ